MSMIVDRPSAAPAMPVTPLGDEVIVWTRPGCVQCRPTIRRLIDKRIPHRELNVDEHPGAFEAMVDANIKQVPFVVTRTDTWTGFRPDKIDALSSGHAA